MVLYQPRMSLNWNSQALPGSSPSPWVPRENLNCDGIGPRIWDLTAVWGGSHWIHLSYPGQGGPRATSGSEHWRPSNYGGSGWSCCWAGGLVGLQWLQSNVYLRLVHHVRHAQPEWNPGTLEPAVGSQSSVAIKPLAEMTGHRGCFRSTFNIASLVKTLRRAQWRRWRPMSRSLRMTRSSEVKDVDMA